MGLVGPCVAGGPLERHRHVRVGLGLASDPNRIERVGLALPALLGALGGAGRAHVTHVVALVDQVHGGVATEAGGALDAPAGDGTELQCPRFHGAVAVAADPERGRAEHAAALVEHRGGDGALVRVGAEHVPVLGRRRGGAVGRLLLAHQRAPLES